MGVESVNTGPRSERDSSHIILAQREQDPITGREQLTGHVVDGLLAHARTGSPVQQGLALRELDGVTGSRDATNTLVANDNRASDTRDGTRTAGRDSVRPGLGDGPATPATVAEDPGMPGFPTPPPAPPTGDGSGAHGAEDAGWRDHLSEAGAYRMADAAAGLGLDNAARHMRHYLGNSGDALRIDPNDMMRDLPAIDAVVRGSFDAQVRQVAEAKVAAEYDGRPMQFQITTPWNGAYATKELSQDWFFAVGGFSYAHTASVTVTPGADGSANVRIEPQLHVFDRYNWDAGKGVSIGPIRIGDEQLGRLHEAGLAQEYEVRGTASRPAVEFRLP